MAEVQIGPYLCQAELGRGSMGVVYRAFDPAGQRHVALKLPLGPLDERRRARLRREAELAARLRHPGVVGIHSVGELPDGRSYLVYELIEGARTLEQRWAEVDWRVRARDVLAVADAVAHAHANGVIHRDLKPDNVLVDPEGRVRITDFGLGIGVDLERLTQTRHAVGTPSHMAPEAFRGATTSPAVDVWSLGVLLYQALTGELPYGGETLQALINAVQGPPPSIRQRAPEVNPELEALCREALETDPDERLENGRAFALGLERALRGEAPSGARRLSRLGVALAAAALAVIGSGSLVALAIARRATEPEGAKAASPTSPPLTLAPDLLAWRVPGSGEVEELRGRLGRLVPAERARAQQELALVEALAALSAGRTQEAWDLQAKLAPEVGEVIAARVREERGEALEPRELRPLEASADPRVVQAARVLRARVLRESDPAAAGELLAGLGEGPGPARERRQLELFAALAEQDPRRVSALVEQDPERFDLPAAGRVLDRRLARAARAARNPEGLREAVAPLAALRASLSPSPWEASPGVDAVLTRVGEFLGAKDFDPASVKAVESLAQAGLAPRERLVGERFADATLALGLEQLQALRARALVALIELGVDLEASHLFEVDEQDFLAVSALGPARTYLALRSRLLHAYLRLGVRRKQASQSELADARRTLARLSQEPSLAPSARARALLSVKWQATPLEDLRASCDLDPNNPWLRMQLVGGLLRAGQKGAATLELERALRCAESLELRERYASLSYQVNGFFVTALHTLQQAGADERARALARSIQRDLIAPRAEVTNTRVAQAVRLLERSVDAALAGEPVRRSRRKRRP